MVTDSSHFPHQVVGLAKAGVGVRGARGAALRSGAPGTGQAERAGRERGTGGSERLAGHPHVICVKEISVRLETLAGSRHL